MTCPCDAVQPRHLENRAKEASKIHWRCLYLAHSERSIVRSFPLMHGRSKSTLTILKRIGPLCNLHIFPNLILILKYWTMASVSISQDFANMAVNKFPRPKICIVLIPTNREPLDDSSPWAGCYVTIHRHCESHWLLKEFSGFLMSLTDLGYGKSYRRL